MTAVRWACWKRAPEEGWLHRMLSRKPRMLVAIALANKMARYIWAMHTKGEDFRVRVTAAASPEIKRAVREGGTCEEAGER